MTVDQVRALHPGDEVTWIDPDDGICTRTLTIVTIKISGDVVTIMDDAGDVIECFSEELR